MILSDDEEEDSEKSQTVTIKKEPIGGSTLLVSNATFDSNMVDLTDEIYEETDVPRHYISWLADLVERAKAVPVTVDRRLEVATVSSDIIVIDEDETGDKTKPTESNEEV